MTSSQTSRVPKIFCHVGISCMTTRQSLNSQTKPTNKVSGFAVEIHSQCILQSMINTAQSILSTYSPPSIIMDIMMTPYFSRLDKAVKTMFTFLLFIFILKLNLTL